MPDVLLLERAFGPVGAFAALLVILGAFFYRRDFLRERKGLRDAHERRDQREERFIAVIERHAGASEGLNKGIEYLGDSIRRTEDQRARDTAEIIRAIREERR
ncbi:MAG: hypothetical protein HY727_15140 [Candidatus Rokubacteria bacterium]|nr:hypothetical protein [Candidatus Rokubacteria bacterium]